MIHDFFLTEGFFYAVRWLYGILGNSYFLTILLVTFVLRLVQIYPDIQSRKTQRKQAALQPQLDALKEKYANDPKKLNEEQSKLMKANGIGCLSGCLPMLLTLPLFFCFLAAFRFWGYEQTIKLTYETLVDEQQAEETFDSFRFGWIRNIWQPDSGFAPVVTPAKDVANYPKIHNLVLFHEGYTDSRGNEVSGEQIWKIFVENGLAEGEFGTENMKLLSTGKAKDEYNEIMGKYRQGNNNGWFILPILAAGFQFLSAWLSQKQTKKNNPSAAAQTQGMNFMIYLFPIMSLWFCLTSTSAFALYWVFSSIMQIATSKIIDVIASKKNPPAEIVQK